MSKSKPLSPAHRQFALTYATNGYNATQAYLTVRPHVTIDTAMTEGSRVLSIPQVRQLIDDTIDKAITQRTTKTVASREYLTQQAHDIGEEARASGLYTPALQSIDIKAKLNHLYDKDTPDVESYTQIMQQFIQVNVTPPATPQAPPPIDITPSHNLPEIDNTNDINELDK